MGPSSQEVPVDVRGVDDSNLYFVGLAVEEPLQPQR